MRDRPAARALTTVMLLAVAASCALPADRRASDVLPVPPGAAGHVDEMKVAAPAPFRGPTAAPALLVYAHDSLPTRVRDRVARVAGVARSVTLSVGQVAVAGRTVRIAAGDLSELRRFTARTVASADEVWTRVSAGEVVVAPTLRPVVEDDGGYLMLGQHAGASRVHVGAFASLPPLLDALVNHRWARALDMPVGNAVLLAVEETERPGDVAARIRRLMGPGAAVQELRPFSSTTGPQTGYLTGGSVAEAVGSFTFVPRDDGTVVVDDGWVSANIRTETVPILGRVTCHRVMLPQLRAALQEVVDRGLAAEISPDEYGGCFHPRYIGHDPAKGLSLHSWGIAVDLNVPGNIRGTVGEMHPEVVAAFKRWGFAWGGDWAWTDPMHFELTRQLVRPGVT